MSFLFVERWTTREDSDAYEAWRAGDGALPDLSRIVARAQRTRYFEDLDI